MKHARAEINNITHWAFHKPRRKDNIAQINPDVKNWRVLCFVHHLGEIGKNLGKIRVLLL